MGLPYGPQACGFSVLVRELAGCHHRTAPCIRPLGDFETSFNKGDIMALQANGSDLNCTAPEQVPLTLRYAAQGYRESTGDLQAAWQDPSAGLVWENSLTSWRNPPPAVTRSSHGISSERAPTDIKAGASPPAFSPVVKATDPACISRLPAGPGFIYVFEFQHIQPGVLFTPFGSDTLYFKLNPMDRVYAGETYPMLTNGRDRVCVRIADSRTATGLCLGIVERTGSVTRAVPPNTGQNSGR